eukprot:TRINITY_DN33330_c0_g1_i1.p1 TRINITY_DN33330_c0_g1~~TRINITY_DN33330_c0_g1_i1.p1  ORF type:complete len:154 (+),score=7.33 TRINITY_DN33330_c0_g1_i1:693-1154(+)
MLIWALMRGSRLPPKTEVTSGSWMPVFTSCTNLYGWKTYLRTSCSHISAMASLLMFFTLDTPCSVAMSSSLAFKRFRAFIFFEKWLLSPADNHMLSEINLQEKELAVTVAKVNEIQSESRVKHTNFPHCTSVCYLILPRGIESSCTASNIPHK